MRLLLESTITLPAANDNTARHFVACNQRICGVLKASAKRAGRPDLNLVDNMNAAKKQRKEKSRKGSPQSSVRRSGVADASTVTVFFITRHHWSGIVPLARGQMRAPH